MKKIVLINPPSSAVIPIGLEIIASYFDLKKKEYEELNNHSVMIIDGTGTDEAAVIDLFKSNMEDVEYVGISSWQSNHKLAMNIAETIKKNKPDVKILIGGPNCYHNYRQILKNNSFIDFIVRGPGEDSIVDLILNKDYSRIPNLVYRDNDSIRMSENQDVVNLKGRALFTLDHIIERKDYFNINELTGFPVSNIYGCIQASIDKRRCSFCSIPGLKSKVNPPEKFWQQLRILNEKYGLTHFYESGDSFVVGKYPEMILKAKPKDFNVKLRVYASPDQITFENLEILKQIGVSNVFIGIENINPNLQKHLIKDFTEEHIYTVLKQLKKLNMKALIGYIYGLAGETKETIANSHRFLKVIVENYQDSIGLLLNNTVLPIMGSDLFKSSAENKKIREQYYANEGEHLAETDNVNYSLLQRLMIENGDYNFSYNYLMNEVSNINGYLKERLPTFDWKKDA